MSSRHAIWPAAALAVALAWGAGLGPAPAAAQMPPGAPPHAMPGPMAGPHVEGHIAFLKAELGITEAQAPLWEKVATAMREDVAKMTSAMEELRAARQAPETALTHLETRAKIAALRADGEARFLAVFRPLYEALSAEQRKIADELLAHRRP